MMKISTNFEEQIHNGLVSIVFTNQSVTYTRTEGRNHRKALRGNNKMSAV